MNKKPNILLFIPDGMQMTPLAPTGLCRTPNFDRIAGEGVRFSRAYTPNPTCSPARASLMTGLLPHNHGVLQLEHTGDDDQFVLRTDKPHWTQSLVQAGYKTGYFGKWHIERSFKLENFGWQVNGCDHTEEYKEKAHAAGNKERGNLDPGLSYRLQGPDGYKDMLLYGVTDVAEDETVDAIPVSLAQPFLEEALNGDQPWCACVSFGGPNEAMIARQEAFEQYPVDDIDLPANLQDDLAGRPGIYRRCQEIFKGLGKHQWREAIACYYARISDIDRQFGKLVDLIEKCGQLDNTIIIITADHGKYTGAHGMDAHNFGAFEEIYNIPLIVSGPGIAKGVDTRARVSSMDLCPTILELAGLETFGAADSTSFKPVLEDPDGTERDFATGYAEYHGTRFPLMQRVYWRDDWKFVFNGFDCDELYDLKNDPYELRNLAGEDEQQGRVQNMMAGIWKKVRDTGDKALVGSHYYSLRIGGVGPDIDKT